MISKDSYKFRFLVSLALLFLLPAALASDFPKDCESKLVQLNDKCKPNPGSLGHDFQNIGKLKELKSELEIVEAEEGCWLDLKGLDINLKLKDDDRNNELNVGEVAEQAKIRLHFQTNEELSFNKTLGKSVFVKINRVDLSSMIKDIEFIPTGKHEGYRNGEHYEVGYKVIYHIIKEPTRVKKLIEHPVETIYDYDLRFVLREPYFTQKLNLFAVHFYPEYDFTRMRDFSPPTYFNKEEAEGDDHVLVKEIELSYEE